jgi:hypothetical protein
MDIKNGLPVIKEYSIDYPPGLTVYSETINQTTDLPLNFLAIGKNGRYDYDYDDNTENVVDLKGKVMLTVEKMTVDGAALFIRP